MPLGRPSPSAPHSLSPRAASLPLDPFSVREKSDFRRRVVSLTASLSSPWGPNPLVLIVQPVGRQLARQRRHGARGRHGPSPLKLQSTVDLIYGGAPDMQDGFLPEFLLVASSLICNCRRPSQLLLAPSASGGMVSSAFNPSPSFFYW